MTNQPLNPEKVTPEMLRESGDEVWATAKEITRTLRILNLMDEMPQDDQNLDQISYKLETLGVTIRGLENRLTYALQSPTGNTGVESLAQIERTAKEAMKEAGKKVEMGKEVIRKLLEDAYGITPPPPKGEPILTPELI